MTPPPLRYPLPTLVAAMALGLLAWRGEALSRPLRASLSARWEKATSGPPLPSSDRPIVVAGPLVRRALLRRDGVTAAEAPGGKPLETFRFRMLADVYDLWPVSGTPTHYRVGNRRPIGWVAAEDVIPWDTRLVVRAPSRTVLLADGAAGPGTAIEVGDAPMPILSWTSEMIQVAAWVRDRPWSEVEKIGWVRNADVPESAWGILLSRDELLTLLRRSLADEDPKALRLRAILGRLADDRPLGAADLDAARSALPPLAFAGEGKASGVVPETLARINEGWKADASWAGLSFMAVPLDALP